MTEMTCYRFFLFSVVIFQMMEVCAEIKLTGTVIGTEEFMYVPIKLALGLEKTVKGGVDVVCQATTRSSIAVSKEHSSFKDNIVCKSKVSSVYSKDRNTYIYNLVHRAKGSSTEREQELVLLITDSSNEKQVKKLSEELSGLTNSKVYAILV